MKVEVQVAVLHTLINGFLDDVDVEKISEWEEGFTKFMQSSHKGILDEIAEKGEMSEELTKKLEKATEDYKETI
jgi:F-type H+-transporting ATPase subunit alpha